jgi:hypothetical protein
MKHETRRVKGGETRILTEAEAAELYAMAKKSAPHATQIQVVEFLLKFDGAPDSNFQQKVRGSPFAFLRYARQLKVSITDPAYAELFYQLTGTVLNVSPDHANAWAKEIARTLIQDPAVK